MELEGRTRRDGNRSGRRIAIQPKSFKKVDKTTLTMMVPMRSIVPHCVV